MHRYLMKYVPLGCLILLLFSCREDEITVTRTEQLLTSDRWEFEYLTESVYLEGTFSRADTIRIGINNSRRDVLTFYPSREVAFDYLHHDTTLLGRWELSKDEVYLSTDLAYHLSATGNTQLFYSYSKIAELTEEKLVLQTDTSHWYYTYEEGDDIQIVPYTTIRASHFSH